MRNRTIKYVFGQYDLAQSLEPLKLSLVKHEAGIREYLDKLPSRTIIMIILCSLLKVIRLDSIYIIGLPIYGLNKVHLEIWKAMKGALIVKLNRTDEQKD